MLPYVFRATIGKQEEIWLTIGHLWKRLRSSLLLGQGPDGSDALGLILATAQFVRNIVAEVPENQVKAIESENDIRDIIHWLSSYYHGLDSRYHAATRMLVQMLSNIVTGNDSLVSSLWNSYMEFEDDKSLFPRLLVIPDKQVRISTCIFILNCVKGSHHRSLQLSVTHAGVRICSLLLNQAHVLFERDEDSENDELRLIIQIIGDLCQMSLAHSLWKSLSVEDEVITPQQITFLKLLDARLQEGINIDIKSNNFVGGVLCHFMEHTRASVSDTLEQAQQNGHPVTLDPRLPHIFEAIIMLNQCTISILLFEAEQPTSETTFRDSLLAGLHAIETIIECLKLLDMFLPRILWGKAQHSHPQPSRLVDSWTAADPAAFSYMKRDLVRLLGILCHRRKDVQDKVRDCGGIHVVLNLCVVDERNPYLREHALFTLRNLLAGNDENQKIVAELEPMGVWSEDGELKDVSGRVRK
ncbi:spinocerebellar ataxia type 10 protein domain-containing protein [Cantharellus anzutake]|uniref:spinocerebellar ataxia type 10 protein domain-containing protein n=1 Tax=Cantharellus anzutake TaxID=1750568 RepID=UPI0019084DA3|nr:spinocerebellar ataxia type 10 protein domain-containing protein [Cantharellus anzutake]KAF8329547.1 spinocerebellar ataxia type 10 protein domain-containing protein [Cantharellus anzutake]